MILAAIVQQIAAKFNGFFWDRGRFETTEKVVKIRFQENTRSEKGKYSDNYVVNCRK